MNKDIVIRGAREHNLKNLNVTIPRDKLVVITGLSGSGKSSLAFDTIYAEGQRRYVESLSAYARQFLGLMQKPDVDSIDGLSPAISIEQKTTSKNPRSTVGTVTEIYDYLRLLFARVGKPHCPQCGKPISAQSAQLISNQILENRKGEKIQVLAPVIRQRKGTYEKLFEDFKKEGYARVRLNKKFYDLEDDKLPTLDRYKKHDIEVVVDRVQVNSQKSRVNEAVENALKLAHGLVIILGEKNDERLYSSHAACADCNISFEELQPRMFSFNSPFGACEHCHGLGFKQEVDVELVIPNSELSFAEGAIAPWGNTIDSWRYYYLRRLARKAGFNMMTPVKKLSKKVLDVVLYGPNQDEDYWGLDDEFEGVIPSLERLHKQTDSEWRREEIEKYMRNVECPKCHGKRLKEKALAVKISKKNIINITDFSIKNCLTFFNNLKLSQKDEIIAKQILKELKARLNFLVNVGLDYLTLSRAAGTLSGGEAQRIRLATQIGSNLMGVVYILDEPSIGLHQRDNNKLIKTLKQLRDVGNTVLVVEHDEDTILNADNVIDIGPGAGVHGGKIVFQGSPKQLMKDCDSLTGQYLCGKKKIAMLEKRRQNSDYLLIKGAKQNNLKNLTVKIPTNVLNVITGVSGSGKSTLIHDILYKGLMKKIHRSKERPGAHDDIIMGEDVNKLILIDQSPIGRTPRSNPATYTKVFDLIRSLFAMTKEAKMRGYTPGRFSFNVKGGRCDNCAGDGLIKIEMHFLPDVYVECEECKGKRYNSETLEVKYKDKSIADVLDMTVNQSLEFFENIPSIKRKLQTLYDVGLGYIKLGQSSTTLSGGEAQRIKLSRELSKKDLGHTLYLLDEPTTGLHFDDVNKLLNVLQRLVDKKNTIIVIEHNLDIIKNADHIIDLGPEGGDEGGQIVAEGTPEQVAQSTKSYTAKYIKKVLEK
ncbi:excinuclease ABC subunit UvrA [Candidatus Woesearchaeota archaeon]|nr:excinuclease ABC subunit UvrA [Candidatus Woesearchaeota archaeon]